MIRGLFRRGGARTPGWLAIAIQPGEIHYAHGIGGEPGRTSRPGVPSGAHRHRLGRLPDPDQLELSRFPGRAAAEQLRRAGGVHFGGSGNGRQPADHRVRGLGDRLQCSELRHRQHSGDLRRAAASADALEVHGRLLEKGI